MLLSFCQANQSSSSTAIQGNSLDISVFISDRHLGLTKWVRETQSCKHFIDIWHASKSLCKKPANAKRENGCEIIGEWIQGIKNHLYWCAISTNQGFGDLMVAKWMSLLLHVADELFPDCAHGEIENENGSK